MYFREIGIGKKDETIVCMVSGIEVCTKTNGENYLKVSLVDEEKSMILAKYWDGHDEADVPPVGTVVSVRLVHGLYQGMDDWKISSIVEDMSGYSIDQFIKVPPYPCEGMFEYLIQVLHKKCKTGPGTIASIAENILLQNKDKFLVWAAAKAMHHAYKGGLLYHTYSMTLVAEFYCRVKPYVDPDILIPAVILHDIGKLRELDTNELGCAEYTVEGQLSNHLQIGAAMVDEYLSTAEDADQFDPEMVRELKHCILSHHGKLEWGAVQIPMTVEAKLLYFIDEADAKTEAGGQALKDAQPGEIYPLFMWSESDTKGKIYLSEAKNAFLERQKISGKKW